MTNAEKLLIEATLHYYDSGLDAKASAPLKTAVEAVRRERAVQKMNDCKERVLDFADTNSGLPPEVFITRLKDLLK